MRILVALILLLTSYPAFAANDAQLQSERARVGANLFKNVCFMMYPKPEERAPFLNSKFVKHEGEKKNIFLQLVRAKEGDVWAAAFPKGVYTIIVDSKNNCHVIMQKGDDSTIHDKIKVLYEEYKAHVPQAIVKYHEIKEKNGLNSSGFEIKTPDEKTFLIVTVSTKKDPPENKPAAFMSVIVAPP